jgi:hypothetical protein
VWGIRVPVAWSREVGLVHENHVAARSEEELVNLLEQTYMLEDPFGHLARSNDRYNEACKATLLAD